jgi:hypothetical protein
MSERMGLYRHPKVCAMATDIFFDPQTFALSNFDNQAKILLIVACAQVNAAIAFFFTIFSITSCMTFMLVVHGSHGHFGEGGRLGSLRLNRFFFRFWVLI